MGEPCEGRTTHHAGCACHEARRDAEVAALRAQLATATASVQQLRADVELATAQRDAETCRADNTETERDVLRAQQAPLVACVDALRAAATSAGWRDADASGETLVAWVRRGEREACAALLETAADEREYAAGRSDDDVDHHDLCTRAKHLRGAAALLRLNTTWLPAKAVREGGK